ncbi:dihydrodipicolinate synthase family protein [Alienimonas chondri]|uniref:4-hydroxy-tetrahydrodipicolinate synthase n=1 Tax=Alienimonas chondri TaxID=2681879 RepID=A0ABX1VPC3_9PLAN|nr:4-hydroxy-tetrahydrodipicolinate synthase [Alienimonas chondri]
MPDSSSPAGSSWGGVFPAAVTHFVGGNGSNRNDLDLDATAKHLRAMLDAGIDGLVMLGTVGENPALDADEKLAVLKCGVETAQAHAADAGTTPVPVLAGVAENTTARAEQFAADAAATGADGLMALPAMIYKGDTGDVAAHLKATAAAGGVPIMIYNNPVSYGIDLKPEDFDHFVDDPLFVAIKESSEDPRRITDLYNRFGDRYRLFCGVDDVILESFAAGAIGWVSGLVNAFPAENRLLWDLMTAGRWDEAREVYRWYMPLLHLDTRPKLVQYIKMCDEACGYGNAHCRPPRLHPSGKDLEEVSALIADAVKNRPDVASYGTGA